MNILPVAWHPAFMLILVLLIFVAFVREIIEPEMIAIISLVLVVIAGVLTPGDAFALFGNNAVVSIGCMFVLSNALAATGVLRPITRLFETSARKGELSMLGALHLSAIPISGFVNNTPLVATLVPILKNLSGRSGISLQHLLIPASFATVMGGTLTLMGTSTNLVVANSAKTHGMEAFGLFEITKLGIIYAIIGSIYMMTIGRRLLPNEVQASPAPIDSAVPEDLPAAAAPWKRTVSAATMLLVIVLAGSATIPLGLSAMIGALIVIGTRCVTLEDVYRTIPWGLLLLITGMLAVGLAMEKSGVSALIANWIEPIVIGRNPVIALSLVYLIATVLTELISNNAVGALLTPIAIDLALHIDVDPRPFVVAVMFGASASFATPIGYQTNTYVYQEGGYRFMDFVKVGLPLNILLWIVATILIPVFWPLT